MMFFNVIMSNLTLFYLVIQIQNLFFIGKKIERLFVPKFFHDRNTVNFLKELQFVGEFDTIDKTGFSENLPHSAENFMSIEQKLGHLIINL